MTRRLVVAVVVLPGTAVVVVPALIVRATSGTTSEASVAQPSDPRLWLGLALGGVGLAFGLWTVALFTRYGNGTPAPWDPPHELVVRGPYRHVRNPMITGVLLMLAGESLVLRSWPVGVWRAVFFVGNAIYFPLVEEPGLERRFGNAYSAYKDNVPRSLPRAGPWDAS